MGLTASQPDRRPAQSQTQRIITNRPVRNLSSANSSASSQSTPKPLFGSAEVNSLISGGYLAPFTVLEDEALHSNLNECNICMNNFLELNNLSCCKDAKLCTKCYVDIRNARAATEPATPQPTFGALSSLGMKRSAASTNSAVSCCPFCNKEGFSVHFKSNKNSAVKRDETMAVHGSDKNCKEAPSNENQCDVHSPIAACLKNSNSSSDASFGAGNSNPSSSERNIVVPKASTADRERLEAQINQQHLMGLTPPMDNGHMRGWNEHSPQSSPRLQARTVYGHGKARTTSLTSQNFGQRQTLPTSQVNATRHSLAGSSYRNSPRNRDVAAYEALASFMGGDVEDVLLQAALRESMKQEYMGTPDDPPSPPLPTPAPASAGNSSSTVKYAAAPVSAGGGKSTDDLHANRSNDDDSSEESSEDSNEALDLDLDAETEAELIAQLRDPSMTHEERLQLAIALSLSAKEAKAKQRSSES